MLTPAMPAQAVYRFAKVLHAAGIDTIADVMSCDSQRLQELRESVALIPG